MVKRTDRSPALGFASTDPGTTGATTAPNGDLGPGAVLGPYVVEEAIARGGFATVYRVRHAETGAGAAVKLLHQHLSASPTMLKRFAREVETLDKLRHPGIVNVLDMGELSTGRPWFAMEWLDGH